MTREKLKIDKIERCEPKGGISMIKVSYVNSYRSPEPHFVDSFIETALAEALYYGEDERLLKVIEFGLTELLDEEFRTPFLKYIKGEHKGRGKSLPDNKKKKEAVDYIWSRSSYYEGRGYTLYNATHPERSAIAKAGKEYADFSYRHSCKLYSLGEKALEDPMNIGFRIIRGIAISNGRKDEVKEIVNNELANGGTQSVGLIKAARKLKISEDSCKAFLKKSS
jgi:hypothetical protein